MQTRPTLNETSFDLLSLLDDLQAMFQLQAASKGLALIFEIAPDVPQYIKTDESKLRQILINLLGNAIEFTPAGKVTLRARLGEGKLGENHYFRLGTSDFRLLAIIALTASALEEKRTVIPSTGCDGFVRKPFRESAIFGAMQKHIGIRYTYADRIQASSANEENTLQNTLTVASIKALSETLVADWQQAASNVDLDLASSAIAKIREIILALAQVLQHCLDNFEYEQILTAIQATRCIGAKHLVKYLCLNSINYWSNASPLQGENYELFLRAAI